MVRGINSQSTITGSDTNHLMIFELVSIEYATLPVGKAYWAGDRSSGGRARTIRVVSTLMVITRASRSRM